MVVALGALLAVAALVDLRRARAELTAARASLQRAVDNPATLGTPQGRAAAGAEIDGGVRLAQAARGRVVGSPPLSVIGVIPGLRGQRSGLVQLIEDSTAAATSGGNLLASVDSVAGRSQLRAGAVPVDGITELEGAARSTGHAIAGLVRSDAGLWGPLGDARREFDDVARSTASRLMDGADALSAARTFMGAGGERRYLVALQNNAEMRNQGAILSYVLTRFTGSPPRLVFERNGSVLDLPLDRPAPTPVPAGTEEVFGFIRPTQLWQSVNATADFAFSGRAMVDMYRQATGQPVDGVIGVDVPGLASLLAAVGPVTVDGLAEPLTATNVSRVLLHDLYRGLGPTSDQTVRKERLGDVLRAVIDRLTTGERDAVALGRELGNAAQGGHIRLFSASTEEEQVFERTGLGGGPATSRPDHTFHLAVENRTATKLDYFVKPSVRQEIELTEAGTAIVRTTVTVDNQAPKDGQPSYQLGPDGVTTKRPGDYLAWLLLWAPMGSMPGGSVSESGLRLSQHVVDVAAGDRRELTFQTVVPRAVRDGRLEFRLVPQPRLEPVPLEVRLVAPGWDVEGPLVWRPIWDRVQTVGWEVRR